MKFNVEVDINSLFLNAYEDGYLGDNLEEVIKDEILKTFVASVETKVDEQINNILKDKLENVSSIIDSKLNALMEEFMNKRILITDPYGDVIEEDTSVKDMLKKKCDSFLDAKVNSRGEVIKKDSWGYNDAETRIEYILNKKLDFRLKSEIESAVDRSVREVKKVAQEHLNKKLGEKMIKAFEMENAFNIGDQDE